MAIENRKKIAYIAFIIYLTTFLTVILPVQEVKANPLAIIAGQVAKKALQKAAQSVGIAILSRAGVKTATGPAAQKAAKAWFQRSPYAAEKLAKGAKTVGEGNMPGWVKVLLGGATAATLINQTFEIGTNIKGLLDSNNNKIANGDEDSTGLIYGSSDEFQELNNVPDPVAGTDPATWEPRMSAGWHVNKTGADLMVDGNRISCDEVFAYIPINEPVYLEFSEKMCFIRVSSIETSFDSGGNKYYTKCKLEIIVFSKSSGDLTYYGVYHGGGQNSTNVPVVHGFYLTMSANPGQFGTVIPDLDSGSCVVTYAGLNYFHSGLGSIVFSSTEVDYAFVIDEITGLSIETPSPGDAEKPLVVQIPDPDYVLEQNPGLTPEQVEEIVLQMLIDNPDLIRGAENDPVPDPATLPDYFPPEVQEPEPTPGESTTYVPWLDTIIDYLRKIWGALNPETMQEQLNDGINTAFDNIMDKFAWYDQLKIAIDGITEQTVPNDDWEGIWIDHPWVGHVCVVDPTATNIYRVAIHRFISASVIFLTVLVSIKKVSTILGGDD